MLIKSKKAISPLIATVFLVGFTIVLAILVFTWSGKFTQTTQGIVAKMTESAESISMEMHTINSTSYGKVSLTVSNGENKEIANLTVILTGNLGSQSIITQGLHPYETKLLIITFDPTHTGNILKVEGIPIIFENNEYTIHSISKQTLTTLNIPSVDSDNDSCTDTLDYNEVSYCPKSSCISEASSCNTNCQPLACPGTKESCGCAVGQCTACSVNEECINNLCKPQCVILKAYWSTEQVKTNEIINLTLEGINCNAQTIPLLYQEMNFLTNALINPEDYHLPAGITFEGNKASTSWLVQSLWTKLQFMTRDGTMKSDILSITEHPVEITADPCPLTTGSLWIIPPGSTVECVGTTLIMDGSIEIYGTLNISDANISVTVPNTYIALRGYEGKLFMNHASLLPIDPLTTTITTEHNTQLEIKNSNLSSLGSSYEGLIVNANHTIIENSYFNNIQTLAFDGNDHQFLNNTIEGNANTAYLLFFGWYESSNNNTIEGNLIKDVHGAVAGEDDYALSVAGDENKVISNTITKITASDTSTSYGKTYLEGAYPLIIAGNHNFIENNSIVDNWAEADTPALFLLGDNNTLAKNQIKLNWKNMDGILIGVDWWQESFGNTIVENTIIRNPGEGIHLVNTRNSSILKNLLDENLDGGNIVIGQSEDALLQGNQIEGMSSGITLDKSSSIQILDTLINTTPKGYSEIGMLSGILLKESSQNYIENVTIIMTTIQSQGVVLENSFLNFFTDAKITAGRNADAVTFLENSYNNTFERTNIQSSTYNTGGVIFGGENVTDNIFHQSLISNRGINSQTLLFRNSSTNNKIIDSLLLPYGATELDPGIPIRVVQGIGKNIMLNTSYDDSMVVYEGNANSYDIYRQWYLRVLTVDASTFVPIVSIVLNITDVLGRNVADEITGASGEIPAQNLTEYIQNQGTKIFLTNYTITAYDPSGIYNPAQISYNLTTNTFLTLFLSKGNHPPDDEPLPPDGGGGSGGSGGSGGRTPSTPSELIISPDNLEVQVYPGQSKLLNITIHNYGISDTTLSLSSIDIDSFLNLEEISFTIKKKSSLEIPLRFTADQNQPPNIYEGSLFVESNTISKEIPVRIEVLNPKTDFHVNLQIVEKNKLPGEMLKAQISLINGTFPLQLHYVIKDAQGSKKSEETEEVKNATFEKEFLIPKDWKPGNYVLKVEARDGELSSIISDTFSIGTQQKPKSFTWLWVLVLLIILLISGIIYLRRKAKTSLESFRHKRK